VWVQELRTDRQRLEEALFQAAEGVDSARQRSLELRSALEVRRWARGQIKPAVVVVDGG
jgi:hypothetical protein